MDRQPNATLENQDDLIARRSCFESGADLAACAFFIEVRAGAIQREVDQLHLLARQNAAGPWVRSNPQQHFRSFGIPFSEFVQRRTPRVCGLRRRRCFCCYSFGCHISSFFSLNSYYWVGHDAPSAFHSFTVWTSSSWVMGGVRRPLPLGRLPGLHAHKTNGSVATDI